MRIVCSLAIALWASSAFADTTSDAANYERLRDRLDERFVDVGEAGGQSMPAHIRSDADRYIRWADATIDLGWYIGVLATELHMRSQPSRFPGFVSSRSVEAIEDQLYFALNALERLDRVADASFEGCGTRESINGFFIRDDIPAGFHSRFGLSETRSDSLDPVVTNNEMSQDQVWHLMIGLALTAKLVDSEVRGRDLSDWAIEQARRIMEHVASMDWQITNPACGNRPVARGAAAIGNRPGAARLIEFITNGALTYEIGASQQRLFDSLRDPDNALYTNVDNQHMAMAIVAVGEGFGRETIDDLMVLAETHDWWAYPLLYAALRTEAEAPRWCVYRERAAAEAEAMIAELGAGEPGSPRPGRADHSFTSSNRFVRGVEFAYVGPEGSAGQQFHGLDFMLLHNLRAIAAPRTWEGGDAPDPGRCAPPVPEDPDAGMPEVDAGDVDAGAPFDGGSEGDAGLPEERGGSGCSPAGGGEAPYLMLLLLHRRRKKKDSVGGVKIPAKPDINEVDGANATGCGHGRDGGGGSPRRHRSL